MRRLTKVTELADVLRNLRCFCAKMSPRVGARVEPHGGGVDLSGSRKANKFGATVVTTIGVFHHPRWVSLTTGEQALSS